ncbi:MAG: 50S ribosomal protein L24 [Candidatus Woesebacteria bacterium GW2011_GWA1_45_8]|uniref:Large ribosomal subunit protein uL24 n=1 Tax=Candidatus Woesebacteria bacterium GW2011_GWA1_45_8 TaxID=1618559 RepID=A0A0G1QUI5_9BACT|nr:MAG: 50S ribosomal protein L24 [Candidatus Woesebacteria bacterium GW2011_GWA1_45_8]
MLKFKVGDNIKVTSGKDKGREGVVEKILVSKGLAIIPGINIYKRHVKGQQGQKGGIYDIPRPLPFSKFALICPKCKKLARVGFRIVDGTKERVCKKCERVIDKKKAK